MLPLHTVALRSKWVVFGATEPTNWWVHASKCHQEILPDAEEVKGAMVKNESAASSGGSNSLASITPFGPLAEVGGLGATNLFASPSSSTRASSSGSSKVSPKKRPRTTTTTTTSSSTSAHHHYAHSRPVLGQFTTLSHNTRPGSSTSTTTTTSSSRKRRAPPSFVSDDDYNYHDDGELDEDDDEEEAEAAKGYSAKVGGGVGGGGVVETEGPEPGWTISSSGRIIRLRDARWGNAV